MIKAYLKSILEISKRGDAREESYYSTLEKLLTNCADYLGKTKIHITSLPKKTEAGNPDFRIWDGRQHIVGYIEAKAPTIENLDLIENSEQLKRYLHTFPNLILNNFFEFRLYRNETLINKVLIGRPFIIHKLKTAPPVENESDFFKLLERFFSFSLPKVYNAKTLAIELAKRTRFLKDEVIEEELKEEGTTAKDFISGFYEAFKKYLIGGLSKEEFADLYSQTISYGLFAARTRTENEFNRKLAYDSIPHTIGILRDVFEFISLGKLPLQMEWIIDDISEVLAVTDVKKILHQFFHEGKGKDPIVHFYETFLAEYNPQTREKRGVYYTPEPVVSYIVRSLHSILKERFNRADGFASDSVTVLDPAAGTLTFLAEVAKLAVKEFVSKYGDGGKENFIREHILQNLYAFELMMAPYAVGHLKMSFLLEELGYKLKGDDRFKLYLTNTLEMEELAQTELPGMASLSEESHLASRVKKDQPILVILGNPPYSGHSANVSEKYVTRTQNGREKRQKIKTWIGELIDDYKFVDGKPLGEKNPKWLQDDYVKFIRFSQWKIDQVGEGILGFITNHSYLDNPTFRGMRQSLMNSFDQIYILDLHGNSLKKEKCPDGSKDENVFDIQQGVAIALCLKKKGVKKKCMVYHSEIWGLREKKNDWLSKNDIKRTSKKKLSPKSDFYLFIPRDEDLYEHYRNYISIKEIFNSNCLGIQTHRDNFVIDFNENFLKRKIQMLKNPSMPDEMIIKTFDLKENIRNKTLSEVRKELNRDDKWESCFKRILYRPFDIRHVFYSKLLIDRPRFEIMRHMIKKNISLLLPRRSYSWHHAFVAQNFAVDVAISASSREANYLFPLYLYPQSDKKDLFSRTKKLDKKQPNISSNIFASVLNVYQKEPLPEEIFYYIYAILYSNIYRTKYAEFLKIDFPRIPFTKNYSLFIKMAKYGQELAEMHLLKSKELDPPISKFQGKGDNKIEKLIYNEKEKRLYFNLNQYFEGITEEIWHYQIGGYQICSKWLKDRKGRILSLRDIKHFCRVITALKRTLEIQKEIDKLYPKIEQRVIEF
ncbi:MAG: N-6 DNA methylase [Candidatus Aminicenantes bacterium]|nr:N-6 DNA methylase [Candidatus Aminicenantes bacterium]